MFIKNQFLEDKQIYYDAKSEGWTFEKPLGNYYKVTLSEGDINQGTAKYKIEQFDKDGKTVPIIYTDSATGQEKTENAVITSNFEGFIAKNAVIGPSEKNDIIKKQIIPQIQTELAYQLLSQTLGRAAGWLIDKACEEKWQATKPEKDRERASNNNPSIENPTNPYSEKCRQLKDKTVFSANAMKKNDTYDYSYTITACNKPLNYSISLKKASNEVEIASGKVDFGDSISDRKETDPGLGDFNKICVGYVLNNSATAKQKCFPLGSIMVTS
jgi:hypothetical protein